MKFVIICFLSLVNIIPSTDNDNIKQLLSFELNKNQKLKSTFSADFDQSSMHIAIIKNSSTGKFELLSFFIDKNENINTQETISFNNSPNIISFHKNNDIVSLVCYNSDQKKLKVIDYNLTNKQTAIFEREKIKNPDNIFRTENKTLLVYLNNSKKDKSIGVIDISNSDNVEINKQKIPQDLLDTYQSFFSKGVVPESVNKNEFVKHGSIKPKKIYFQDNEIIITKDYKKIATIDVLKLNLKSNNFSFKEIKAKNVINDIKSFNSFYDNGNIFSLQLNKEDFLIDILDSNKNTSKKSLSLKTDLKNTINQNINLSDFLKEASKGSMEATLTINPSKDKKQFVVTVDKVNRLSYSYYYNWWWHHQWFMMNQQMHMQQHMNSLPRFGPNTAIEYYYPNTSKTKSIEIYLDDKFDIINKNDFSGKYNFIDKEANNESFNDNSSLYKMFSSSFTKDKMRYIYFSKSKKKVVIYSKNIKQ